MINLNKKLFLLRHGETEHNLKKIMQGQADIPLTDMGRFQAGEVALKAKDLDIDVLICSDLSRAHETAQYIRDIIDVEPVPNVLLREKSFGEIEGLKKAEIAQRFPKFVSENGLVNVDADFPGAERLEDFYDRVVGAIASLQKEHSNKNIMIVAHAGVLRMMYAYANEMSPGDVRSVYNPPNCFIECY